jgi:phage FluMu protein Com
VHIPNNTLQPAASQVRCSAESHCPACRTMNGDGSRPAALPELARAHRALPLTRPETSSVHIPNNTLQPAASQVRCSAESHCPACRTMNGDGSRPAALPELDRQCASDTRPAFALSSYLLNKKNNHPWSSDGELEPEVTQASEFPQQEKTVPWLNAAGQCWMTLEAE